MLPWRDAKPHVLSCGLHCASGVFEGESCHAGNVFKLRAHTDRLVNSAAILGFKLPYTADEIDAACIAVLAANNVRLFRPTGHITFGELAVLGFFAMSGFLFTSSYAAHPDVAAFAWKRAARIVPGPAVAHLVTLLVAGSLAGGILTLSQTPAALLQLILLQEPQSNGAFANVPDPRMNNSTWIEALTGAPRPASRLLAAFETGACAFVSRQHIVLRGRVACVAAVALAATSFAPGLLFTVGPALGGHILLWLVYAGRPGRVGVIGQRPGISYGLYLYTWPVQNTLVSFLPGLSPLLLVAAATPRRSRPRLPELDVRGASCPDLDAPPALTGGQRPNGSRGTAAPGEPGTAPRGARRAMPVSIGAGSNPSARPAPSRNGARPGAGGIPSCPDAALVPATAPAPDAPPVPGTPYRGAEYVEPPGA